MNNLMNPTAITTIETARGFDTVQIEAMLTQQRNIYIYGEINESSLTEFLLKIQYLIKEDDSPINIFINSPGGSVNAGLAMYDIIQGITSEVNMYCIGMAASMGAIIFCGGQKGRRFILEHSQVMIHEPLISGGVGGSASSIEATSKSIIKTRELLAEILSKHTGKTLEEILSAISFDNFMSAEEAIEFGLCDEIVDSINLN